MDVALLVAIAALVVAAFGAVVSRRKASESNDLARRALRISEAEHGQHERDREARARLSVSVEPGPNHERSEDGAIWTSAGAITTTLVITITNSGDRAAGKTQVEVWVPRTPMGSAPFWAEAGGQPLAESSSAAVDPSVRLNASAEAPLYDSMRLPRTLDSVAVDLPEQIYVRVTLGLEEAVNDFPVDVKVRAEGAEEEAKTRAVVVIKRRTA